MKGEVTVVVEASVSFACGKCGKTLEGSANGSEVDIEPCEKCLQDARDEGFQEGEAQ